MAGADLRVPPSWPGVALSVLLPPQDARETRGALAGDPASWPGVLLRGRGRSRQMEPMRPLSWTWSLLCRLLSPGLASGATACPLRRQSCLACVPRRWWPSASKTHLSHLKFSFFYAKGRVCVCVCVAVCWRLPALISLFLQPTALSGYNVPRNPQ